VISNANIFCKSTIITGFEETGSSLCTIYHYQ